MNHQVSRRKYQIIGNIDTEKIPIIFDFSISNYHEASTYPQVSLEIMEEYHENFSGLISLPYGSVDRVALKGKKIWVRSDWNAALMSHQRSTGTPVIPLVHSPFWRQILIDGFVSTLNLGNSDVYEADNIQYLAMQRNYCFEMNQPMIIDLHLQNIDETHDGYVDALELGVNLAVELDCDSVIAPFGKYLIQENKLKKIIDSNIFVRGSINEFDLSDWSKDEICILFNHISGIILTHPQQLNKTKDSKLF